jgi:oligoendopeptidase F
MSPIAEPFPPPTWHFVLPTVDAGSLATLEPVFDELLHRRLADASDLHRFLRDESELQARIAAEQARRYVAMTRSTEDADAKAAYLAMENDVMPRVKVRSDELDRRLLSTPALAALGPEFEIIVRKRRTQVALFRAENTELQREEADLQTRQQALAASVTVEFAGKTLTLQQVAPFLESQDRAQREAAYRAALAARQAIWPKAEALFDRLVELRTQIGRNAGFTTYTPFRFQDLGRYDYDEQTCRQLHDAIAEHVVPAVRSLDADRAKRLGIPQLRPWDLEVDAEGRAALRPFTSESELVELCRRLLHAVEPEFADWLLALRSRGLLDLMSRKGKAPGGYQYQLEDERVPFIFANGVGLHGDVQTLLHESGHAIHSLLCRHHDLLQLRDYPIEIAETASMSMELLGLEHIGTVYSPADASRTRKKHLEHVLRTLTWIASIDAFQHWVYAQPRHSHEERRIAWLDIRRRFGGAIDWSGLDDALAMQWIAQSHLFTHAFYYIEYGIAQLAALQVWQRYRRDPRAALANYRRALALGGSKPLPELFAALEVRFDLSAKMVGELVADVMRAIRE